MDEEQGCYHTSRQPALPPAVRRDVFARTFFDRAVHSQEECKRSLRLLQDAILIELRFDHQQIQQSRGRGIVAQGMHGAVGMDELADADMSRSPIVTEAHTHVAGIMYQSVAFTWGLFLNETPTT